MTHTITNYLLNPISNIIAPFIEASKRNSDARVTVKALSRLSDRELRDIGISRGDIYSIAYGDPDFQRGLK